MAQFLRSSYYLLPQVSGIYLFLDENGNALYVGKAKNLKNRVSSYFSKQVSGEKTKALVAKIDKIKIIKVSSELESLLLEAYYIKKYHPPYNIILTDDKNYLLIKITKNQRPKVLLARQADDPKSIYFGPFPSSKTVKMVLRRLRKIFPFQSVINHPKRICLFNHLGLCPCPPVFNSPEHKKTYRKNINNLVRFLQGKTQQVINNLKKERGMFSKKEQFEQANAVQKQIDAIIYITSPIRKPIEYEINPNLSEDLRQKELQDLSVHLKIGNIQKIECFDISNTSGTNATGSMAVFNNGEKDPSSYRRFKIRLTSGPNDFVMMQEVIQRRLKHAEWQFPDLIIVDGGKGQISSALKALKDANIIIPVIGLAKREEVIITQDFREIRLPKSSKALHLVMRIRDEAHRFAITYHRKLRSKFTLLS
ncbi:MAG: GIY-YIG nuclease family protein [Candidatus Levyibacteriota bacterium]|nr:MAG: GIY-YIG nuclease family protein [Candidatus Levybacteria bacterium]